MMIKPDKIYFILFAKVTCYFIIWFNINIHNTTNKQFILISIIPFSINYLYLFNIQFNSITSII